MKVAEEYWVFRCQFVSNCTQVDHSIVSVCYWVLLTTKNGVGSVLDVHLYVRTRMYTAELDSFE